MHVAADVDVRGTLVVDRDIPVEFQSMACEVDIQAEEGTDNRHVQQLVEAAERSCVVLQTSRSGVPVETTVDVESGIAQH
ncbi:hypothetical protein [Natrialba sp. PRR66]|uniref:OsmC family protein n=1 Tax=Natrialba sp. PRR66 TaxID=3098146 RepID=UPI002B1D410E|nr:hypothetical protein [Natrialba sp. PRR66]